MKTKKSMAGKFLVSFTVAVVLCYSLTAINADAGIRSMGSKIRSTTRSVTTPRIGTSTGIGSTSGTGSTNRRATVPQNGITTKSKNPSGSGTTVKSRIKTGVIPKTIRILSIQPQSLKVKQLQKKRMPSTCQAVMSDHTIRMKAVTWSNQWIDTKKLGTKTYYGIVSGATHQAILKVTVVR